MNFMFIILSIIDIFSGALILYPLSTKILFYFGLFSVFKGLWTITSFLKLDPLSTIDIIGGITLLLISKGVIFNFFIIIGYIIILKGIYCLIASL